MDHDEHIAQLTKAVRQQMTSPATPYVADTHARLIKDDTIDEDEALKMITYCLADEVERIDREDSTFDEARYKLLLDMLPTLPSAD